MSPETQQRARKDSLDEDASGAPNPAVGPYAHMFLSLWFPWLVNRDLFPHPYLFLFLWFFTGLVALIGITFLLQNICEYEDHCHVPMSVLHVEKKLFNPEGGSFSSSELPGFVCFYWVDQLRTARAGTLMTEPRTDPVDWRDIVNAGAGLGHGPAVDKNDTWKNDVKSTGINHLPLDVERPWVNGLEASSCEPPLHDTLIKAWQNSARKRALAFVGEEFPWCDGWSPADWRDRNRPLPPCLGFPKQDKHAQDAHEIAFAPTVPVRNSTYYARWLNFYCYKVQRCPSFVRRISECARTRRPLFLPDSGGHDDDCFDDATRRALQGAVQTLRQRRHHYGRQAGVSHGA